MGRNPSLLGYVDIYQCMVYISTLYVHVGYLRADHSDFKGGGGGAKHNFVCFPPLLHRINHPSIKIYNQNPTDILSECLIKSHPNEKKNMQQFYEYF